MRWRIELAEDREGRGYRFVIESRSTWMEDTEGRSQSPSLFSVQRGMVKSAFTVRAALRFDCWTYRYSTSAVPVYYSPRPMATVIHTAFMICYPVFDVCFVMTNELRDYPPSRASCFPLPFHTYLFHAQKVSHEG